MNMLIRMGAEAYLYKESWHGKQVIIKFRKPKEYRIPSLDQKIREYRTIHEAKLLTEARKAGVPTPVIYQVDLQNTTIIMEFIDGPRIKELFSNGNSSEEVCRKIGRMIGKLHNYGIVHGDLTTSNMIYSKKGKIYLIDFGLGDFSNSIEAFGVDLHLLKRAMESTHFKHAEKYFTLITNEYIKETSDKGIEIMNRLEEIRTRGRYVIRKNE